MKSEKGITLTSLVIYVVVATIAIGAMAMISSLFFSNMNLVKDQNKYAPEFNKFNMFFLQDVKNNKLTKGVTETKITFEDDTIYQYKSDEKAIYRNDTKITEQVQAVNFKLNEVKVANTTKQVITVTMKIGAEKEFPKEISIEYVLKYW